ncbi:MAG: AAA family ATPase [Oscillospiraceae bacterium]
MEKKLILVTSPPACGKTYISKELAKRLDHVVYLDKDTLIPLSKQIFAVANQPYDRSSQFFEDNIRDYEYECIVDLALEALDYDNIVLINAPFTREIRDMSYIDSLKEHLAEKNAKLVVIWVETSVEVAHQRMIKRNSDRDTWKLAHWDEYIAGCNFTVPTNLQSADSKNNLIVFKNNNDKEFEDSMSDCLKLLEK